MAQKVKPIPEGYHSVTPFLIVKEAEKAIQFYKNAFGAEEIEKNPSPDGRIMHASLKIGNSIFMLADEFPNGTCGVMSPASLNGSSAMLHLYVEDVDAAFQKAVKAGAKVQMEVADTFWGDRYGQVEDPFGHRWSLATRTVDLTPEEIQERGNAFMKEMANGCK